MNQNIEMQMTKSRYCLWLTVLWVTLLLMSACRNTTEWYSHREKFYRYQREEQYDKAVESGLLAVRIAASEYGSKSDSMVVALGDLGDLYVKLMMFTEADSIFNSQLKLASEIYLPTDTLIAATLNKIASVQLQRNNFAKDVEEQLLLASEIIRANEFSRRTAFMQIAVMHNLIQYYIGAGQSGKAASLAQQVVQLCEKVYGHYELLTLDSYITLASTYKEIDSVGEAKSIVCNLHQYLQRQEQDTVIRGRISQIEHVLAAIYLREYKLDSAQFFASSSASTARALGNRIGVAGSYLLLGKIAHAERKYEHADSLYQNALTVLQKYGRSSKSMIGNALLHIGENFVALGRDKEAIRVFADARQVYRQAFPAGSSQLRERLRKLDSCASLLHSRS